MCFRQGVERMRCPRAIGLAGAALVLPLAAACGDGSPDPGSNAAVTEAHAAKAEQLRAYSQRIVFVDFFKTRATLFVNGRAAFSGLLDVEEANETTGLSRVLDVHLRGRTTLRIVTDKMDSSRTIDVTPATKNIYISPQGRPPIEASTVDTILLD